MIISKIEQDGVEYSLVMSDLSDSWTDKTPQWEIRIRARGKDCPTGFCDYHEIDALPALAEKLLIPVILKALAFDDMKIAFKRADENLVNEII